MCGLCGEFVLGLAVEADGCDWLACGGVVADECCGVVAGCGGGFEVDVACVFGDAEAVEEVVVFGHGQLYARGLGEVGRGGGGGRVGLICGEFRRFLC